MMRQLVNPKNFGRPCISLAYAGCANRPIYHILVFPDQALGRHWEGNVIEKLGSFDPLPNARNEKLVALKIDRIKYWLGVRNAHISTPVLELLGLAGLLPIHPKTFLRARINRLQLNESIETKQATQAQLHQIGDEMEEVVSMGADFEVQQLEEVDGSDEATTADGNKDSLIDPQTGSSS